MKQDKIIFSFIAVVDPGYFAYLLNWVALTVRFSSIRAKVRTYYKTIMEFEEGTFQPVLCNSCQERRTCLYSKQKIYFCLDYRKDFQIGVV